MKRLRTSYTSVKRRPFYDNELHQSISDKVRLNLTSSQKDNYVLTTEEQSEISALFSVETDHIEDEHSIYDRTYEPNQQVGIMGLLT